MIKAQSDRTSFEGRDNAPPGRDAFAQLAEPYRRQIKAYCYRMVGSLHEAEDLTQETFLKAWRAIESLESGGSLKAWLYRIATRMCLDSIRQRKRLRRILPDAEFPPATAMPSGQPPTDPVWLEPYPDKELDDIADETPGPDAQYEKREAIRLAFVAAIQYLPPRQRAILLLIDVLGWSPGETVTLIGGSIASINSALQRARATLSRHYSRGCDWSGSVSGDENVLLDRYVQAWEAKDVDRFVALLKDEATYVMPPWRQWYQGRDAIGDFFGTAWPQYGRFRLLRTAANCQPAFVLYAENKSDGGFGVHSIHVLTVHDGGISSLALFMKPIGPRLAQTFGFPTVLRE